PPTGSPSSAPPHPGDVAASSSATAGPSPIDGTYFSATSILTFNRGSWTRNLPAMDGSFTVSGNTLVLRQRDCPGDGAYTWSLEGERLILTKIKDSCAQRDVQFISTEKWGVVHELGQDL